MTENVNSESNMNRGSVRECESILGLSLNARGLGVFESLIKRIAGWKLVSKQGHDKLTVFSYQSQRQHATVIAIGNDLAGLILQTETGQTVLNTYGLREVLKKLAAAEEFAQSQSGIQVGTGGLIQ